MARASRLGVQVLPQADVGEQFGLGLGAGLGQGLQTLLQQKTLQMQQRQQAGGIEALGGLTGQQITPEQAQAISTLDPQIQREIAKQLLQAPSQQAYLQALNRVQGNDNSIDELGPPVEPSHPSIDEPNLTPMQEEAGQRANPLIQPGLKPEHAKNIIDLQFKGEKNRFEKQKYILDNYLNPLRDQSNMARQAADDYKTFLPLIKSGNVITGRGRKLLEDLGLEEYFTNPETATAQAILDRRATGAATAFSTKRLTNLEVSTYKGSLAQLRKPQNTIEVMAKNEILKQKAIMKRHTAAEEILDKNPNVDPVKFENQLEQKIQPTLKKLADKALKNVNDMIAKEKRESKKEKPTERIMIKASEISNYPEGTRFKQGGILKEIRGGVPVVVEETETIEV